jgi:hypothetical protein
MTKTTLTAAVLAGSMLAGSAWACTERLVPYGERAAKPQFQLELGSKLHYFGAEHSNDPQAPQFAEIEKRWQAFKPSVAFYEGPNRPLAASRDDTIRSAGESGLLRFLAQRDGVPVLSLEPSPKDEIAYVLPKFSPEQVALFYTLREAARLRERRGMQEAELTAATEKMLEQAGKMGLMNSPIRTIGDLAAAYRRTWSEPAQWWQAPMRWFDPRRTSAETGGVFTNELNAASSHYRDINMLEKLSAAANSGKAVFAVVGRDHVAQQADALRCAIK